MTETEIMRKLVGNAGKKYSIHELAEELEIKPEYFGEKRHTNEHVWRLDQILSTIGFLDGTIEFTFPDSPEVNFYKTGIYDMDMED